MRSRNLLHLAVLPCVACGPDLPSGWEDAEPLPIAQGLCEDSAYEGLPAAVSATARAGGLDLIYDRAHFRCAQRVEGFIRWSGPRAEVLVQPEDMDPSRVPDCDCLYRITASLDAPSGPHEVAVFRRGDNLSGQSEPVAVGAAQIAVP